MENETPLENAMENETTLPDAPSEALESSEEKQVLVVSKVKNKGNLGPEQFRPWLAKVLLGGGVDASVLIELAAAHFKKQMNEADIEPVMLKGKQKFTHTWQRRLYDSRKGMVSAGLMYSSKYFRSRQERRNWWALTPKGQKPEHRSGY